MVLALAAVYVHFGQLAWIQGMFYGIGAAVSAIIARSAWKLIQKTVGKDYLLWILFAILAVTTVWVQSEIVWLFILSGFVAMFVKAPPKFGGPSSASMIFAPVPFMKWLSQRRKARRKDGGLRSRHFTEISRIRPNALREQKFFCS